ncbi:MAG: 30S ribosomal protein S20 [Alphaproteobacteria bacterium]|nr:30S ribosomal protein S20 [Alphaproteobacteria bacterium]
MAYHKSAEKRIRQNGRRGEVNGERISRIRTFIKRVEAAIEKKDSKAATAAFLEAQPEIMRGVSKGVLKKNTAARKISRLSAGIRALAG